MRQVTEIKEITLEEFEETYNPMCLDPFDQTTYYIDINSDQEDRLEAQIDKALLENRLWTEHEADGNYYLENRKVYVNRLTHVITEIAYDPTVCILAVYPSVESEE